jgi:uncharacterized protein (DUF58 family)
MDERLFGEEFLRKLERLAYISRRAAAGQLQGERRSSKRGQSVEFADFRPYSPGDDFRRIDWNAYARLERFFLKLYIDEEDLTVHFLIDASRSMNWGEPNKLWYALRVAGALGYVSLVSLDRVTVTALGSGNGQIGKVFPPARGKKSAISLFTYLQSLSGSKLPQNGRNPSSWLGHYAANNPRSGPLVLLSDLMDDGWQEGLNYLASRGFEITLIQILSPDEVKPDLSGDFKLVDSETQREIEITADFESLERYQQGLRAWQESWRRFCSSRNMRYLSIASSLPLDELLFSHLRQHGVLK